MKGKKLPTSLILISFLMFNFVSVSSQETITLKNGTKISGTIEIVFSKTTKDDKVVLISESAEEQEFSSSDIQTIEFLNGEVYVAKKVQFYFYLTNTNETKIALLRQILSGDINLYKYRGSNFKFALEANNRTYALQKTKPTNDIAQNYKGILLIALSDKIERKEIFDTKFREHRFIHLVNKYNKLSDDSYIPLVASTSQTKEGEFGFRIGINQSNLTLETPLVNRTCVFVDGKENCNQYRDAGDLIIDDENSTSYFLAISYSRDIPRFRNIQYLVGLTFQGFSFPTFLDNNSVSVGNLKTNEFLFSLGLSSRLFQYSKFTSHLSVSPFVWIRGTQKKISVDGNNIVDSTFGRVNSNKFGFGISPLLRLDYTINPNFKLTFSCNFYLRNGDDYFTGGTNQFIVSNSSTLDDIVALSVGFKFKTKSPKR